MPTFANDYIATRVIATRLTTLYGTTKAATYSGYGGVDVVMALDEDTEAERIGKPFIIIDQQDGGDSEWSAGGTRYRYITALVACCANDFSGAQVATSNPVASVELMSRDLVADINNNYATWRDAGLLGIEINADRPQVAGGDGNAPGTVVIPHRVTFHYEVGA